MSTTANSALTEAEFDSLLDMTCRARRLAGRTPAIADRVRAALTDHWTPNGWMTDGVCWVVTASN